MSVIAPVYGPAYPTWAADHEGDPTRRDLARELLCAEATVAALRSRLADVEAFLRQSGYGWYLDRHYALPQRPVAL